MEKNDFSKNKVIGKNAEEVFGHLVNSLNEDWKVIGYGVEQHVGNLRENIKGIYTNIADKIRCMPDFVVINQKTKEIILFEVKRLGFIDKRKSKHLVFGFQKGLIEKYIKYWEEAKLVVIHHQEPYFHIIDFKDIDLIKHKLNEFYISEDNMLTRTRPMTLWNFHEIRKDIKQIFPNLKDEIIEEARKMILDITPKVRMATISEVQEDLRNVEKEVRISHRRQELELLGFDEAQAYHMAIEEEN